MKANTVIQLILLVLIVGLGYLIVSGHGVDATEAGDGDGTAATTDTISVAKPPPATPSPDQSRFVRMASSLAFETIIKTPTPIPRTPPPPKATPTPIPIDKVLAVEQWRLAGAWKGRADIELMKKKDGTAERWIEMRVGDQRVIKVANRTNIIELVAMDEDNVTITLKMGEQTHTLKAF